MSRKFFSDYILRTELCNNPNFFILFLIVELLKGISFSVVNKIFKMSAAVLRTKKFCADLNKSKFCNLPIAEPKKPLYLESKRSFFKSGIMTTFVLTTLILFFNIAIEPETLKNAYPFKLVNLIIIITILELCYHTTTVFTH